jgi:hypothetical protein
MPSFKVFKGTKEGKAVESTTTKPDQLEGDQVLLRVTASGICGTGEFQLLAREERVRRAKELIDSIAPFRLFSFLFDLMY